MSGPATVRLLDDIPRPVATRLVVTTAAGRAVTATRVTAAAQPLRIPSGTSGWLRVTIAAARGGTLGGPGRATDVTIPGVRVTSYLQPAQDQSGPPVVQLRARQRHDARPTGNPPEADLNRTFTTPAAARFHVSASVTAVPGAALNTLLDRLGPAAPAQLRISATSTFGSLPALRPQNLLDGTGWIAAGPTPPCACSGKGGGHRQDPAHRPDGRDRRGANACADHHPGRDRDVPVPPSGILRFPPDHRPAGHQLPRRDARHRL